VTRPLPLPARIALAVTVTAAALVLRLLLGVGRLGLWLLTLAGFRGARLLALAATALGVWWAAGKVGLRPAVWLAVIGWVAWAVRHYRAVLAQHAAVRRLTTALQQHTDALAAAGKARLARPATATARSHHVRGTVARGRRETPTVRAPGPGRSPTSRLSRPWRRWAVLPPASSAATSRRPIPRRLVGAGGVCDDHPRARQ
jgi:hypothetical protein